MERTEVLPGEIKVLHNQIYEYKKGVRNLVLFTMNERYLPLARERLERQNIPYLVQRAGKSNINLYFGQPECLETIRTFVGRPLNRLTPKKILSSERFWDTTSASNANASAQRKKTSVRPNGHKAGQSAETRPAKVAEVYFLPYLCRP